MGLNLNDIHDALRFRRTFGGFDDFASYTDTELWTKLAADAGSSVAITASTANGVLALTTGGTDNNEAAVYTTNKVFKFLANKPLVGVGRIQYAEANADDANVAFGFSSAFGANLLVDDGAGPASSFSGALIYKVDGGTAWKCISSVGSGQNISTSTLTPGGSSYQTFFIECRPISSTICEVTFLCYDEVGGTFQPLFDSSLASLGNRAIKHQLTYTSAAAMNFGAYVKAGGGNSRPPHRGAGAGPPAARPLLGA
jgi:hypothetical protein